MAGGIQQRRLRGIQSPWLALLLTGLILGVFLIVIATSVNPTLREELKSPWSLMMQGTRWTATWGPGTAHENLWTLSTDRQLQEGRETNALFLSCKRLLPAMLLILQIIGMGGGLLVGRALRLRSDLGMLVRILAHVGAPVLVIGVLLGFMMVESRLLGLSTHPAQWGRVIVWVIGLGLYFGITFSLASWIGSRVKDVRRASWILLSLFVGLLLLEGSRELFWPMSASELPQVPELPTEVRRALFRPSGEPRVTEDREELVAEYLATVDNYSTGLAGAVEMRYRIERLWNFVCPQLVLREISFQLLQDDRATITEIIYMSTRPYRVPSLRASLAAVKAEAIWLVVAFVLLSCGALRSQIKRRHRS